MVSHHTGGAGHAGADGTLVALWVAAAAVAVGCLAAITSPTRDGAIGHGTAAATPTTAGGLSVEPAPSE